MKKYEGRADKQLAKRLEAEPNIPAASTFPDRATAESASSKALDANKAKIEKFLEGKKGKTTVTHTFPYPVGVSLLNGSNGHLPASKVLLVLVKDVRRSEGYFLLTGFAQI
ncbi:RNase A-like domain-containing protein [Pseudomonas sp. PB120]|uniref:RNase A-like domain-containing protein n=1 Tax=Pseudomonas sp. PB120 TaxID=2494700 RepID=UPI0015B6D1C4